MLTCHGGDGLLSCTLAGHEAINAHAGIATFQQSSLAARPTILYPVQELLRLNSSMSS